MHLSTKTGTCPEATATSETGVMKTFGLFSISLYIPHLSHLSPIDMLIAGLALLWLTLIWFDLTYFLVFENPEWHSCSLSWETVSPLLLTSSVTSVTFVTYSIVELAYLNLTDSLVFEKQEWDSIALSWGTLPGRFVQLEIRQDILQRQFDCVWQWLCLAMIVSDNNYAWQWLCLAMIIVWQ